MKNVIEFDLIKFKRTPQYFAAQNVHIRVIELLINHGTDFRDGIQNMSYLHWAARNGELSIVECLAKKIVDINEKDKNGKTPLRLSIQRGKSNVIEFLKSKGGRISQKRINYDHWFFRVDVLLNDEGKYLSRKSRNMGRKIPY